MWFPLMKKVTYINDAITNDVTLSYEAKVNYTAQQNNNLQKIEDLIPQETDLLLRAKENATALLTLASEGNIHCIYDEDGRPKEILIMDTNDINTAKKVWRWNANGFGYSKNGIDGPYELAMTMDGAIVADFITAGHFSADRIQGGIIKTSEFEVEGQVVKYASDYTEDDHIRANRITLGIEEATIEDLEKYDLDGDGNITILDVVKIGRMISGEIDSITINTSVKINPLSSQQIIKTNGVSIGTKGLSSKSIKSSEMYSDKYYIKVDEVNGYRPGYDGIFQLASGETVTVINGMIYSIN
jgi:hypothetical protein